MERLFIITGIITGFFFILSGCSASSGLLKTQHPLQIHLNQLYTFSPPSLTGSVNQKGPLFFRLILPRLIQNEWDQLQNTLQNKQHNQPTSVLHSSSSTVSRTSSTISRASSWISGNQHPKWIRLNPKLARTLSLKHYRDLKGVPYVHLSQISFGSVTAFDLKVHLLRNQKQQIKNQHIDAHLDLAGLIAFIGGNQARGRIRFDTGMLEIDPQSTSILHNKPQEVSTPVSTTSFPHLERFIPLWSNQKAFGTPSIKSPFPVIGRVYIRENATLKRAREELGLSSSLDQSSLEKSSLSPKDDFVFLWTFPKQELPQSLWLFVKIDLPPQTSSDQTPSSLYFRIYLNSKFRQDHLQSTLIKSKWHSSNPLILPVNTPITLVDIHRGSWSCFHPVCIEQISSPRKPLNLRPSKEE